MPNSERFPFIEMDQLAGSASSLPVLPFTLKHQQRSMEVIGLLDTGSTVNVVPYPLGIALGVQWDDAAVNLRLTGNLARYPAQPLFLEIVIRGFPPVELVFAWTRAEDAPLLLGHVNFFAKFDVCFFRSQGFFELTLR